MLGDAKLNSLDTRLEQFKLSHANNQQELQVCSFHATATISWWRSSLSPLTYLKTLLKGYSQLLEDYKALKNYKFPEQPQANGVSSASTPVNEKPRNPYVLVLIDGNGYVVRTPDLTRPFKFRRLIKFQFNDELVKDKEEGGMRAARMLNDVVEKLLREHSHARDSRVVVRIYADVTNLSKQLAKTKLIGLEKRSIMPFAAGFTRALGHFDFVDALDEEGTRFKIRGELIRKTITKQGDCTTNHTMTSITRKNCTKMRQFATERKLMSLQKPSNQPQKILLVVIYSSQPAMVSRIQAVQPVPLIYRETMVGY